VSCAACCGWGDAVHDRRRSAKPWAASSDMVDWTAFRRGIGDV
jgi:hypothetical protein